MQKEALAQSIQYHVSSTKLWDMRNMKFKNMQEALKYIALQAKNYPTDIAYYSSEEYKKIYPELCRLNRLLQTAYNVHHRQNR